MKYIVIKTHPHASEDLFIFPETTDHNLFYSLLNHQYPSCTLVSAGKLSNYHDEISHLSQESLNKNRTELEQLEQNRKDKQIQDSMDLFYKPESYYTRKRNEGALRDQISKIFVQGLSY
jgi:hypothetical protein